MGAALDWRGVGNGHGVSWERRGSCVGVARELPQLRGRGVRGALEGHGREGGAACQWEGVGGRGVGERGVGGILTL